MTWLLIALYPTLPGTILHSNGHAAAQWAMRLTSSWSHVNYLPPAQPSSHQQPPEAECSASQTSPTVAALQSLLHVARDCRHVETRVKERSRHSGMPLSILPTVCLMGRGIRRRKNKLGMPGLNHLASFENDTTKDLRLVRSPYAMLRCAQKANGVKPRSLHTWHRGHS